MIAVLRAVERLAWSIAAVCLAWVSFTLAEQAYYRAAARALGDNARAAASAASRLTPPNFATDAAISGVLDDVSPDAVPALADVRTPESAGVIGELEVPHLHIATAVLQGDDRAALRRGAGHVRQTSLPWEGGNTVLAGHRDTVFRRLGELQRGDRVRVSTAHGVFDYRVSRTLRVSPRDLSVLRPEAAALTLITCYPFTWVGTAPERWIVQAERIASPEADHADARD